MQSRIRKTGQFNATLDALKSAPGSEQHHSSGLRAGMETKQDKVLQQRLQQEEFRIRRSIIQTMNEIELPGLLQEALVQN